VSPHLSFIPPDYPIEKMIETMASLKGNGRMQKTAMKANYRLFEDPYAG
jgi:hypothetical protein